MDTFHTATALTPCGCGLPRCIEPEVSGMALAREAERYRRVTSVADFFISAPADAQECFLGRTALALATEINILDPDIVILGGGVFEGEHFPKQRLEAMVLGNVRRPLPHDNLHFVWFGKDISTGLRGAWNLYKETLQ